MHTLVVCMWIEGVGKVASVFLWTLFVFSHVGYMMLQLHVSLLEHSLRTIAGSLWAEWMADTGLMS